VSLCAVLGAAAVMIAQPILPYAPSLAAMIFVVVEELIPESQRGGTRICHDGAGVSWSYDPRRGFRKSGEADST
jgi:zinc transporter ZupT